MWLISWNENRPILTWEKNITNGFVNSTLKQDTEMWRKKTYSEDNIMQEKNVWTYAYYIMKSALNLCVTLYEWWQPQYHIHCTYNTFISVLLFF